MYLLSYSYVRYVRATLLISLSCHSTTTQHNTQHDRKTSSTNTMMPTTSTASSNKADNDIELTVEEAKQLETAFKDADFCKLLSDYVSEISNPEFKEEQEKYIAQLEAKNELPAGKALVRPSSGFVVKCTHKKKRQDTNKLFLNIVIVYEQALLEHCSLGAS